MACSKKMTDSTDTGARTTNGIATVDLSLYIYKVGIAEGGRVSVAAAAGVIALAIGLASTALWLRVTRWEQEIYR